MIKFYRIIQSIIIIMFMIFLYTEKDMVWCLRFLGSIIGIFGFLVLNELVELNNKK